MSNGWPSRAEKDCSSAPETAQAGRKALEEPEPHVAHATGQTDGVQERRRMSTRQRTGAIVMCSYEVIGEEKPEGRAAARASAVLPKRNGHELTWTDVGLVSGASSSSSRASERSSAWVTTSIDLPMQTPARFTTQSLLFSYRGAVVSCENSMWLP